jgi:hypothetical protein
MKSNLSEAPRSYLYFVRRKQGRVNRIDQNTDEFKQRKNKILLHRNACAYLTYR